jgi:ATPase subunit of ABC transporter with duplicated ATPase domains
MPPSVTFSALSWSTPDGRPVLSNLDLAFTAERAGLVGRNGVGKSTLLALIAGELSPRAGAVTTNGTLGLLRQSVQAEPGETVAGLFGVDDAMALLARIERGEADAEALADADWTLEARMTAALGRLGLDAAPQTRLATLSGGQRMRAALAALVFREPDFILLDEPTNNLDRDGRRAVIELLDGWPSGAIVVSHDRALLETMDAIVELTSLGATRYGGPFSHYRERKALELAAARHDLADAEKRVADLAERAQATAERQARRDRAGRQKRAKGDTPPILLNKMRNDAENTGADNARLAERRRSQALQDAVTARRHIEVLQPLIVVIPSTGLPAGKTVLRLDQVSAGYVLGHPVLQGVSLTLVGPERVAVTGANGSGKTTLLALVSGRLDAWTGSVQVMTGFAMLDQQVGLLEANASIRDNFRRLNTQADENACRASLARFMFRADAALQVVATLSGGQKLRAGLACVLGLSPPPLLILDEPTNNLDLDSIEAVEAGLRGYDGALLVVSHDEAFLEAIGFTRRVELQSGATR